MVLASAVLVPVVLVPVVLVLVVLASVVPAPGARSSDVHLTCTVTEQRLSLNDLFGQV
ncbi:hypothetical protein ACH4U7_24340 [Streptomyces sp. NPDC020845]|uniref:hypothetical protein n=1 Tax=Streptomyces sp. NPDC020845 TaxID=3365096 RepID=UPI0037BD9830